MPTFYSDLGLLENNPNIGARAQGLAKSAILLWADCLYTMLGTEAAADKVRLFRLPPRAKVDPMLSTVVTDGIATTATIDIGDDDDGGVGAAVDVDRYADGLDVAAAGVDKFDSIIAAARLTPYVTSKDCWCELTFVTLVTPVAARMLRIRVGYAVVR